MSALLKSLLNITLSARGAVSETLRLETISVSSCVSDAQTTVKHKFWKRMDCGCVFSKCAVVVVAVVVVGGGGGSFVVSGGAFVLVAALFRFGMHATAVLLTLHHHEAKIHNGEVPILNHSGSKCPNEASMRACCDLDGEAPTRSANAPGRSSSSVTSKHLYNAKSRFSGALQCVPLKCV